MDLYKWVGFIRLLFIKIKKSLVKSRLPRSVSYSFVQYGNEYATKGLQTDLILCGKGVKSLLKCDLDKFTITLNPININVFNTIALNPSSFIPESFLLNGESFMLMATERRLLNRLFSKWGCKYIQISIDK
jgi:hypothetical protein